MATPYTAAAEMVLRLGAVGVRATTDPRKLVAPGILITPPRIVFDVNCGGTATWTLYAVASAPKGDAMAWQQIDQMLGAALDVLQPDSAEPAAWAPDQESPAMPAYRLTLTAAVGWDPV